ncbi:MAG TPA: hypothetical protein VFW50_45235 [Streptosporangiaceae bacterium]|nr:hypothetical protein [Streptosporangiaceae bacterium]
MTEDLGAGWHRLHPVSPLIQGGGLLSGLLGIFVLSLVTAQGYEAYVYQLVAVAAIVVAGLVRWLVTRWKLTALRCVSRPACCAEIPGSSR